MTACLMAVWLAVCPGAGAVAHPASAAPDNGMGSCAALGSSVGEAVWSWCYKNERDNLNGCKASFRSWVREVERTCAQRRREFGCSPSDHTAVEWHVHGWKQPGRELSLHRAVQYCDDDKQGRTAGPGPGDAPPALDRETRVRVQRALAAQGFDAGQADGSFGPRTRGAIRAWQQAKGHATTGELTGGQVERLLADSPAGSGAATGDLHGSIAFSQLDGGGYAFGIAWNALGREAARRSAVEECGRRGGGGGCSEAGWFRNACGAIAIGDANGYGTGWGENTGEAESSALSRCRSANANCRVAMSRCVDGQYNQHEAVASKPVGPMCAGMSKGSECWNELANKPGCYIFDGYYNPPETATWSGACADGIAVGQGTWGWKTPNGPGEATGTLVRGKQHGRWIFRYANGHVYEGPFVNGEQHGRWVHRYPSGARLEFDYHNGSREGQPGVYITKSGKRDPGRWAGKCFRDNNGHVRVWSGSKDDCPKN